MLFIHLIAGKCADLDERAPLICQVADTLTGRQLILLPLPVDRFFPPPNAILASRSLNWPSRYQHGIFILLKSNNSRFIAAVIDRNLTWML